MKILVDENIPYIKGRLEPLAEVEYLDQFAFTPERVRDADALVIRTRTRCDEGLLSGSKVRGIATATIGMDQIDIPWCEEAGIEVANCPGCNAPGVAQYVWSSVLRLGFKPEGGTIGVVGCGNVGSIVAQWGRRLGARVLVNDPLKEEAGIEEIHGTEGGYVSLETVLRESDVVTLHTPLTRSGSHPSFHLIGDREFGMLREGSIFVNAARGPVVDSAALERKLREGKIRSVIDTWEGEPVISPELLALTDIGTYHIAGYSDEGKQRATRMSLENLERMFGIEIDKSGLAGAYSEPELTVEGIVASYDPFVDSGELRAAPEAFDRLRHDYHYRKEVR